MQRVPVFLIVALLIVALYYLTPLRDYMQEQFEPSKTPAAGSEKAGDEEDEPFDKVSIDLLVVSNKVANMEGKLRILEMAKEHPDWFTREEYDHLSVVMAANEEALKKAKEEYERVKEVYARETATKIIRESLESPKDRQKTAPERADSLPAPSLE